MRKLVTTILLLLLLVMAAAPVQALAAGSVAVEIPFTVNGASATVVMEALEGAPEPETGSFANVTGGKFRLSYTELGAYHYKIYQRPGADETLEYDGVTYDVVITVYQKQDGTLGAQIEAWVPGNSFKAMEIIFSNPPGMRIDKDQRRNDGSRTKELVWGDPGDKITYYITVFNGSSGPVYDVTVTDAIPAGMRLVPDSISDGGGESGGVVSWQLGDLPAVSSKTVFFSVIVPTVNKRTIWTNIAEGSYATAPAGEAAAYDGTDPSANSRAVTRYDMITNEVEAIYSPDETPPPTPTPTPPVPTPPPTASPSPRPAGNLPKTGDESDPAQWLGLLSVSVLGLGIGTAIGLRQGRQRRKRS